MLRYVAASLLAATLATEALAQSANEIRFVSCPIYRDTDAGRKSGCWLADARELGQRYDVTLAPTKPDWNREVLVEGVPTGETDACGGVVLDPVRVSVLAGACTRQMLPPEGYPGRPYTLPPRNVRPLSAERALPTPPFEPKTFHMLFDFNKDFIVYQLDDWMFDQAATHIRGVNPSRITVTGYAATTPATVSGRKIAETPSIAKQRAQLITEALTRLGVDPKIIRTRWKTAAKPVDAELADGLVEPSRRRVEIEVTP